MPFMRKGTQKLEPCRYDDEHFRDNIHILTEIDAIKFILATHFKFDESFVTNLANQNYLIEISPQLVEESHKVELFEDKVDNGKIKT